MSGEVGWKVDMWSPARWIIDLKIWDTGQMLQADRVEPKESKVLVVRSEIALGMIANCIKAWPQTTVWKH